MTHLSNFGHNILSYIVQTHCAASWSHNDMLYNINTICEKLYHIPCSLYHALAHAYGSHTPNVYDYTMEDATSLKQNFPI